ncbi:MAG: TonB-dependent receptor, partial [Bacteroidales bacterium]|nr:TonB-dependent receptor [Bacteroidales bacterium]
MPRTGLILVFLFASIVLQAQGKFTVSGYVRDAATGEEIIAANVAILDNGSGTFSNTYGYYSLSMESGFYTLVFSYVGYGSLSKELQLDKDLVFNVELRESTLELEEVTISAERPNANITNLETGSTRLPIQTIRKIPAFLGEVDIIKAIQLLPGVQVTSEGSSGFSVRGGGRDQNLILLDEATVYNASHLIGFFSVFNNDAIKDVKLYKGDIPASAGGRLASLLDVRMKEGNRKQFSASGGIGTIASRLTLEGPIVSDKVSFLLSARRTYADLFLKLSSDDAISQNRLYFIDLNGKVNYTINDRNRIYFSSYYGKDVFANDFAGMFFGNRTFTLRWNHLFSKKLFSNFTLINSHYFYDLGTPEGSSQYFNWMSMLNDYGAKGDFIWYPSPEHTFRFGGWATYHGIKPGEIEAEQGDITMTSVLPVNHSLDNGLYFSGESDLGEKFSIRYGLRYSMFHNMGPATVYEYDDDYQVTDSILYERGDFFNTYHGLEPRFATNYAFNDKQSVKASYART